MWPDKLLLNLKKLSKYYELVVFTILPKDIVNQIYNLIPAINDVVSHTLTYDDLVFMEGSKQVYKDISLLEYNRVSHFTNDDQEQGEIMVIDIHKGEDCVDS